MKFFSKKVGTGSFPEFEIGQGEVVQIVFPKSLIELGNQLSLVIKHILDKSTFSLVKLDVLKEKKYLFFQKNIRDLCTQYGLNENKRLLSFLKKESVSLETKVLSLGYNLQYIISLEIALLNNDFLVLNLAGLDRIGIIEVVKIIKMEDKKSFILLKEETNFTKNINLGGKVFTFDKGIHPQKPTD